MRVNNYNYDDMLLKEKLAILWRNENSYITPTEQNVKNGYMTGWDAALDWASLNGKGYNTHDEKGGFDEKSVLVGKTIEA